MFRTLSQYITSTANKLRSQTQPKRVRFESFGAILQLLRPRALVFVDRTFAAKLRLHPPSPSIWREPQADGQLGKLPLSAPLEAHMQLTNRCNAGCKGCYTAATPRGDSEEWGLDQWKQAIDHLSSLQVFHVALGGGESAQLPWLRELASYCRTRGVIPNLTTSGLENVSELVTFAHLFGQINVSMDGLGQTYARVRGFDGFSRADQAVIALRKATRSIGINVVVTRHNFSQLEHLFHYARKRKLNEVELLRFKPAGRGKNQFQKLTCTPQQHRDFLPTILSACRRSRVRVRVDCSYTPMLAFHRPGQALLAHLAAYGCTGGDFLIGVKASGRVSACSFAEVPNNAPSVDRLSNYWTQQNAFGAFRQWQNAQQPCATCEYHSICRGGCKVVAAHVLGDSSLPDPECPTVVAWKTNLA